MEDLKEEFEGLDMENPSNGPFTDWIYVVNEKLVLEAINAHKEGGIQQTFIDNLDNCPEQIKNLIINGAVCIFGKNHYYDCYCPRIAEEDRKEDAMLFILAEVLCHSLKGSGYVFCVYLEPMEKEKGYRLYLKFGEYVLTINQMLNYIHTKQDAVIDPLAYKHMPETTELWFNTLHCRQSLEKYVANGDKTFYNEFQLPDYSVCFPDVISQNYDVLKYDDPWHDEDGWIAIAFFIRKGLSIITEYWNYLPIWENQQHK